MSSSVLDFDELLDGAARSAVHLEMRDSYGGPKEEEDFARWLESGEQDLDPRSEHWAPWVALIRRTVQRGVAVRRARIVSEPVSDYVRFEYGGTPVNILAGEQVRWLPRRRASAIALPGNDFWLIDDRLVLWNHFAGSGASAGGEMCDDPAAVRLCSTAFESVWEAAIPHEEYKID